MARGLRIAAAIIEDGKLDTLIVRVGPTSTRSHFHCISRGRTDSIPCAAHQPLLTSSDSRPFHPDRATSTSPGAVESGRRLRRRRRDPRLPSPWL